MKLQMHLSGEQRKSLEEGEPLAAEDGGLQIVILRADIFEKIKSFITDDGDWSEAELRALASRTVDDADHAGPIP